VLTPDRAVCPAWEHLTPGVKVNIGVCHWGYDWHQYVYWGGDKQRTFQPGETFTIHYVMTGYTPAEGEELFLASRLHPRMEDPEPAGEHFGFLQVPSLLAYPVVEPAGTSFDKLYDVRMPYIGWQWYGDYDNDRQVGHTDRYSMRIDGPASAKGMFYHHMIDGNAKRYLCTFWLKTEGYKGPAPVAILRYPWDDKVRKDVVDTGLTGDNHWTEFSFITTMPVITPETSDASQFDLIVKGVGKVWLDDWSVRPLGDDEQPGEKRGGAATPPSAEVSPLYLVDLQCNEAAGLSLWDASGRNNHGRLHSVTWINAGNRPALHFDGTDSCAFVPMGSPELRPEDKGAYKQDSLTMEIWVCPTPGLKGGGVLCYGLALTLQLQPVGDKFQAILGCLDVAGGSLQLISQPTIAGGRWTHLATTVGADGLVRLYVDGQPVAEKALDAKLKLYAWEPTITIGAYGTPSNLFAGELTGVRLWSRVATPEEIAAEAARSPG